MLSPDGREELRRRAFAAWERAKALEAMAGELTAGSRDLRAASVERRLVSQHLRGSEVARVDNIIAERGGAHFRGSTPAVPGVGLVVAGRIERIGSLNDTLHERVGRVCSARDPAIAVGLAIVEQPDLAVLDDDLPLMTGLDAAVLIRAYAPAASLLLLTDDSATAEAADREGVTVADPGSSPEVVLGLLDSLMA